MRAQSIGIPGKSVALSVLGTVLFCLQAAASPVPFYRVIEGERPATAAEVARDRYLHGADVLYTADVPRDSGPRRVNGVVWHSNLRERQYYLGSRNPVTDQEQLLRLIENDKWAEARLLMEYAPESFPRTERLSDVQASTGYQTLAQLREALAARYPRGYFLKPIAGFNSAGTLPTDRTRLAEVLEAYQRELRPEIEAARLAGASEDDIHFQFKERPHYEGRVIEQLLASPETVIIQEKVDAVMGLNGRVEEYRVHVVEGRVLKDATQNRWEDGRFVSPERLQEAERAAQGVVDRLPPGFRKMCFGMDLIRTQGGLFQVIELNAGGESGYLYPETDVWVANLLAARYSGGTTPLLTEFEAFRKAPTLAAQEEAFARLLARPELREYVAEVKPMTELYAQAKDVFLKRLGELDPRQLLFSLRKFHLTPYLSAGDLERLGGALANRAGGPGAIRVLLGLGPREFLFFQQSWNGTTARFLGGMDYGNLEVVRALAEEFKTRAPRAGSGSREAALNSFLKQQTITPAELDLHPERVTEVRQRLTARGSQAGRLFYHGSRAELMAAVFRALR